MMSGKHRQRSTGLDKFGLLRATRTHPPGAKRLIWRRTARVLERSRAAYEPATITSSFLTDLTPGTPEATRAALSRFLLLSAVP